MAQIITRMYASPANAASAAKDLRDHHFGDNEIFVCSPATAGATAQDVAVTIAQSGVSRDEAGAYADGVLKGAALVVVHAPFGTGKKATYVLDRYQPIPSPVAPKAQAAPIRYDEAAPASSTFNWPLKSEDPTPFSTFWKLDTLTDFSISRALGFRELSPEPAPLSKAFGWALLRNDPTPLSSKLNMPLLRD